MTVRFALALISAFSVPACKVVQCSENIVGGKSDSQPSLGIVNGANTDQYPSVVFLYINSSAGAELCSGTFIGSNVILSASHCAAGASASSISFATDSSVNLAAMSNAAFCREQKSPSPSQTMVLSPQSPYPADADLSLLIFSSDVAPAVSSVTKTSATPGQVVTLVGYGINAPISNGAPPPESANPQKRVGTNTLQPPQSPGTLLLTGPSTDAGAGDTGDALTNHGDSGGPLFLNNQVVGVTADGGLGSNNVAADIYVDLGNSQAQAFLAQGAAAGAKISFASLSPNASTAPSPNSSVSNQTSPGSMPGSTATGGSASSSPGAIAANTGSPGGCSSTASLNGVNYAAACNDGTCLCKQNGNVVSSCAFPGSTCESQVVNGQVGIACCSF